MTGGSDVREKTRAVFLAFVMITSVFGATIAFSGSAAAAPANQDQSAPSIQSVEVENQGGSAFVYVTFDEPVYANAGGTGDLQGADFGYNDNTAGTSTDLASSSPVTHTAGSKSVKIELDNNPDSNDVGSDEITIADQVFDGAGNSNGGPSAATINANNPDISSIEAEVGSDTVVVTFTESVNSQDGDALANADIGGAISYTDSSGDGASGIDSVSHTSGAAVATLTLDSDVQPSDLGSDSVQIDIEDLGGPNEATSTDTSLADTSEPFISSAATADNDNDGTIDAVEVTFSEPIDDSDSTLDTTAFTVDSFLNSNGNFDSVSSGTEDDNEVTLQLSGLDAGTGDGSGAKGDVRPDVQLEANKIEDRRSSGAAIGNAQDFGTAADGAAPVVTSATTSGQNEISLEISEQISNTDSDTTVTLNGNALSTSSPDDYDVTRGTDTGPTPSVDTGTISLDDIQGAQDIRDDLRLGPGDDLTVTVDDGSGQTTQADVTNNLLDVSVSPADSTRGSTPTITVDIDKADGSDFTSNAQVSIVGLDNTGDNAQGQEQTDGLTDDAENEDYDIVASGTTSGGTFTTALTLKGQDDGTLINEYFIIVRKGGTSFTADATSSGVFSSNGDLNNIDGSALLSAAPNVSVDSSAQSVERGESVTISGSVATADSDTSASGQTVNIDSPGTNGVGTATTADNGDFATSATLTDAATHDVTLQLYNSSVNSLERDSFETIDVTPNSVDVTSDTQSISSLQQSGDITLDMPDATDAGDNVTRYKLSGVSLDTLELTDSNSRIEQLNLSDGTTLGSVDSGSSVFKEPDGDTVDQNVDDTGSDEFSAVSNPESSGTRLVTTSSGPTIEEVVILADTGTDDEDVVLQVDPAEPGTLTAQGQVENNGDSGTTPTSPDFVGSADISVPAPGDLTALANPASIDLGDAQTDADNTDDVTVSVLDSDGAGLSDQSDANIDDGDIQAVTITLTGNGTEFALESEGGEDTGIGGLSSYDNTGESLSEASITIDNEDTGNADTTTEDFVIESLEAEQNGTVDITVTADVVNQNSDITANSTVRFTDSDTAAGLSPSTELTSGNTTSISINLTDGTGTPVNNRIVDIFADGGVGDDNLFNVDTDGDGDNEQTGVDLIRINGQTNQIEFDTDGQSIADDGSVPFTVNNGEYRLDGVEINAPGQSVTVQAVDSGNIKANFPSQFTTVGQSTFDIESDVDPLVAGFQEQANLTVTNTTSGAEINGSALNDLLDNDAASDTITQEGNDISSAGADLTSGDAVDLDDDGTNDAIQVDITPQSTADVNISIDNGDGTETGSGTIGVVEPEIETNVENNVLTERLNQSVDVTAIDPRDGSRLASGDETADIRVTVLNGTAELRDLNNKQDSVSGDVDDTGSDPDSQAFELNDNGDSTRDALVASDVANSNLSLAALPYDPDNEQFKLEFQVDSDAGNFFGSTNVTVEPPQVTATPSSITLGSQETLEVIAEDANGNALAQRSVRLDGAVQPISGSTDDSGFVAVTVNPQATGTINVHTASADDIETSDLSPAAIDADGSIEDTVNVTTEQNEFNVTVDPQTVTANESSTVTVTATNNASGDAVEGASVDLSGAGVNQSAQTDANGQATFDVNASQAGTIDVTVDGAGFTEATASITVQQPSEPVATVTFDDKTVQNGTEEITVDSANFTRADGSAGDYVVVVHVVNATEFDGGVDNSISAPVGASENLSNGAENITVDLNSSATFEDGDARDSLTENVTLRAMLHTTDNESAFGTRLGVAIDGLERGDETDDANITVQQEAGVPEDPAERALQAAGVNNASAIEQSDITTLITLRDRGDPANGVDVTQDDITNLITLRDRAQ